MNTDYKKYTWIAGTIALVAIAYGAIGLGLSEMNSIKHPNGMFATITVSGEGEVTALPDIATVTGTVRESAKTVPEAQKLVEKKITDTLTALSALGIDKKDIKTLSYTVNPKYETQQIYCIAYPCPQGQQKVVGYEVVESVQIKVRKIDSAGDVLGALGTAGLTELSGPEFTVEDMDKAQADAKALAIEDAQAKAKETARALHVRLGEITQFNENNGGYYPMYYKADAASAPSMSGNSVTLPQGESVIKSNISITYSIE